MKIKRTYAATMREALAQVKLEQGADAVILGNKKVPGGVEILSAVDFDHEAVDAYAGNPALPVSQQREPNLDIEIKKEASVASMSAGNASSFNQSGDPAERKEPVLGIAQQVSSTQVVKAASPKRPAFQGRKVKTPANKSPRPIKENSPGPTSRKLPVEEEALVRETQSDRLLTSLREKEYKQHQAQMLAQPAIKEVKDELKNLRNLMQSQLNVLEWDRYSQRHPVRSVLLNLMTELGLGVDVCELIISQLGDLSEDPQKVWQRGLGVLASAIPIGKADVLSKGGRIALVGSTGVGKTTTIAKIAARFAHIHGQHSVALVSTDNFRIGAQEQLQHFARMLEIPLLTANKSSELTDRLKMLADKKLVLIDTAGMSQTDVRLSEQFHKLQHGSPEIRPYLVLSANTQLAALNETIKSFAKVKLAGGIITKLDESASLGGIITTAIRHQLPLAFCGTGQRVPEDLQYAKNHRLVSRAVSLMQRYAEQIDKDTMGFRYNNLISHPQN